MPRITAISVLEDVLFRRIRLQKAFSNNQPFPMLESKDQRFLHQLVLTTLRHLGQIDDLVDKCLDKPLPKKAAGVKTILRLGVSQIFFLRTPNHAALYTSVELAKDLGFGPYKNLINAVLRRLTREGDSLIQKQDETKLNTPLWLWNVWNKTYGEKNCRLIAMSHQSQPPLDLTIKKHPKSWVAENFGHLLPTDSVRVEKNIILKDLPGYDDGAWWVQDFAASLPVKLLGNVGGLRVVDLCAAPGGKTAQLASSGAEVVAVDKSAARINLLKENLLRLNLKAEILNIDILRWKPQRMFDAVLLDSPCTATGTIRRHPDIPYIKQQSDVEESARLQVNLLDVAIDLVRPGGKIVFSTCSLQPEEGQQLVDEYLLSNNNIVRLPIKPLEVGGMRDLITANGDVRTLPFHMGEKGGMDGFFISRFVHK